MAKLNRPSSRLSVGINKTHENMTGQPIYEPYFELLTIGGKDMSLRDATREDLPAILDLHQQVFTSGVDATWFNWKYGPGKFEGVGIWHEGRLIAFCGGIPRTFLHDGVPQRDLQIGDVMVAADWRVSQIRHGPYFYVTRGMYESRLGKSKRFHTGFGFPNARVSRLGIKAGLGWSMGKMMVLSWDCTTPDPKKPLNGISKWFWSVSRLAAGTSQFEQAIDCAWGKMREASSGLLVGDRHASYMYRRFAARPGHEAVFLRLGRPWHHRASGVAVLSASPAGLHWLDWVGEPGLMKQACEMCKEYATRQGFAGLTAWASAAVLEQLDSTGITTMAEGATITLPNASAISKDESEKLKWWFMGGDTDFL